ncbi:MAG: hypothetical protein Q9163_006009 [Psora crenata]
MVIFVLLFERILPWTSSKCYPPLLSAVNDATAIGNLTDMAKPQLELVISHFAADPTRVKQWLDMVRYESFAQRLGMKTIIYTKNPEIDLQELKDGTAADEVHLMPNIGRESGTILHHIITTYDHPAPFTMFAQDEPFWVAPDGDGVLVDWFANAMTDEFGPNTAFLGLGGLVDTCHCGNCNGNLFPLLNPIYTLLEKDFCHSKNFASLGGQFIVSRSRIQAQELGVYKWLHNMITAPQEHWLHEQEQPSQIKEGYMQGHSTPDNPLFGHTLERTWSMLFGCSYEHLVGNPCNGKICHCRDP